MRGKTAVSVLLLALSGAALAQITAPGEQKPGHGDAVGDAAGQSNGSAGNTAAPAPDDDAPGAGGNTADQG